MSNFQCPHCGMTNIDCGKDGYKTPREIELEEELEQYKIIEKVCKNIVSIDKKSLKYKLFETKMKLKIAEEVLKYYAESKMPDNLYTSEKINGSAISTDIWAIQGEFNQCKYKVYYDNETAQQALQKMKEDWGSVND